MNIVVLTGAGVSAESGISTFRDIKDGLWYNYNVDEVATANGWKNNPELVLEFHNMLRNKLRTTEPNSAHSALVKLEEFHDVTIITQNVDDLHEKAGSTNILHIHGELMKGRDSKGNIIDLDGDLNIGDLDEHGEQIRPHTVLFGEYPYNWEESLRALKNAEVLIIIGTSFSIGYIPQLVDTVRRKCKVFYIDPNPDAMIHEIRLKQLEIIEEKATVGLPIAIESL